MTVLTGFAGLNGFCYREDFGFWPGSLSGYKILIFSRH